MSLSIQLIRHGRTDANERMVFSGKSDVSVTENGMALLKERLTAGLYTKTEWYYTSGMKRTFQTLECIFGDVEFTTVPLLDEYDFGDFEMKSNDELMASDIFIKWRADKTGEVYAPNGENNKVFLERILKGIDEVIADAKDRKIDNITIVSHGGTISFLYRHFTGDWESHSFEIMPKHGEGYLITLNIDSEAPILEAVSKIKYEGNNA